MKGLLLAAFLILGGCTGVLEQYRSLADDGIAVLASKNQGVLVQIDIARKRLKMARCHNPMLTPNAIVLASQNPRLGRPWINQLLDDCPQFRALIATIVSEILGLRE